MKRVVLVKETQIDMKVVQQILQRSHELDRMKKDIKESLSLLCGLIKIILREKVSVKSITFGTEDKGGFYWVVNVYNGGFSGDRQRAVIGGNFGFNCCVSSDSSDASIDYTRVEVVWAALPSLYQVICDHIPEITEKLAPFRKAGKR